MDVPKPDWKDKVLVASKIGASLVPYAGGPIVELLNLVNDHSLFGKRVRLFLEDLNNVVTSHEKQLTALSPEKLASNESFISTLLHAIQASTRAHQKEKLTALRNAVLNSALPSAPDEDLQLIFINLLDSMTASHIKMLLTLPESITMARLDEKDNPGYAEMDERYPDMMPRSFYMVIMEQLKSAKVLHFYSESTPKNTWVVTLTVTSLGKGLIRFITSPVEDVLRP